MSNLDINQFCPHCGAKLKRQQGYDPQIDGGRNRFVCSDVRCRKYIEFSASTPEKAVQLLNTMFEGQQLFPIEQLHEDDGFVMLFKVPIEEPPIIASRCSLDVRWELYTHFSRIPMPLWMEDNGVMKPFKNGV